LAISASDLQDRMEEFIALNVILVGAAQSALPTAVQWVEGALLGSVATGVAVIAVALFGYGMLTGRLDVKSGLRLVLGAFILFGAPSIAREIAGIVRGGSVAVPEDVVARQSPAPEVPKDAPERDPYAGAGLQYP
jgi:type IV secretory pathway VirB2 component (pilin)